MKLKHWRMMNDFSLEQFAQALGVSCTSRTVARIESGESSCDADMVERIVRFTSDEVTAGDLHDVRLAWLRENRPDKFQSPIICKMEAAQ